MRKSGANIFFMFLQINIVMNNFLAAVNLNKMRKFSINRKFIRDKIGEWRIQNGTIPDYKIKNFRGHDERIN